MDQNFINILAPKIMTKSFEESCPSKSHSWLIIHEISMNLFYVFFPSSSSPSFSKGTLPMPKSHFFWTDSDKALYGHHKTKTWFQEKSDSTRNFVSIDKILGEKIISKFFPCLISHEKVAILLPWKLSGALELTSKGQ